ncbi:MAG: phenylacetate--CoA ligase family protein [Leeuwenhoekiella sp.]
MNLFDLSLRLSGYPIKAAREQLQSLHGQNAEEHNSYTERQKFEIAQYHLENNRFYQNFTGITEINSWESLPILRKPNLQLPYESLLSSGFKKQNIYLGKTSGSSGEPFIFAKDKWCHALSWASFYLHYKSRNIDLSGDRQARFYGIPLRGKLKYVEIFKDFVANRSRFPVFDLSTRTFENSLAKFEKTPFSYINGYTSSILLFTKFLRDKNIILKDCCPSLKGCIVTSEMLFENDRLFLNHQLGVPIINEYGASEAGLIGFENDRNQLIIDEKLLFVEVVDDAGKSLPYGEKGNILITSLYNKAQPFIRYAIGDLGILDRDKESGKLYFKKLSGRNNDNVKLPNGTTLPGLAFYYITKTAMETSANVKEFVAAQTSLKAIEIIYVSDRPLNAKEKNNVGKAVRDYLGGEFHTSYKQVETLKRGNNGKLKQFICLV